MPTIPSAAKLARALSLHQSAQEVHYPGEVTIAGRVLACTVFLGTVETRPLDEGGTARVQRLNVEIRKTVLASPPARDALVRHGGVDFKILDIGGRNVTELAWVLECQRFVD